MQSSAVFPHSLQQSQYLESPPQIPHSYFLLGVSPESSASCGSFAIQDLQPVATTAPSTFFILDF